MNKIFRFVIGALIIAAGVIYGLSALGLADINVSFDGWWALFIIVPCLDGLIRSKDKIRSFVGLAFGVALLLAAQGVIEFEMIWKLIVPVIIVLIGIKVICRATSDGKGGKKANTDPKSEEMAAFTSKQLDYSDKDILVSKVGAVFGGAECNLLNANFTENSQIDVFCAFGGADIIVPENINIKTDALCLFGGISDKRAIKERNENAPTLRINGFCIFGGVDIKDSVSKKENK